MTPAAESLLKQPMDLPEAPADESRSKRSTGTVRPMERADLPAVADLFTRTFRKQNRQTDRDLAGYLETVFFSSPLYSPEVGSLVHLNENSTIDSTILAMPIEYRVHGRPVTARVLCAFMAEGKSGAAGAARLARMLRAARQDFCFTDNASPVSADHWVAGGGLVLPIQSLEWHRTLRPITAGLDAASRKAPFLAKLPIRGLALTLDRLIRRSKTSFAAIPSEGTTSSSVSLDQFLEQAQGMMERFCVHPVFSKVEFDWLIAAAKLNTALGELKCRNVIDPQGKVIGSYLYFGADRGNAVVLNALCHEHQEAAFVAQLFADLDSLGYVSAQGMAQPFLMNAVLRQRHLVHRHTGYFCLVTRHADLKAAAIGDGFYAGGLASENWSRLLHDF
ncbi:GNAT family N-acetyltransferase [Pararhizobium sp. BT-229]|uniref:GNAT family N-acetyltransferase n=1 Tax=Pararhizobium sp. BT-229 TaxID=2986923 RepID=UPI0021F794E4|nr:GNAT family N-acetyltransferase [Pararhizobium sp. BT-229]MCV9966671.1 GNAT family N-acetyltransferase [Pararhizobium sp. BT-229]